MSDSLTEAREILGTHRGEKPARDFMSNAQRDALAEDYASRSHFLSASHFHSSADKRSEFERLFREGVKPKNN